MVIATATAKDRGRGLPLSPLHRSEQQDTVQNLSSDAGDNLSSHTEIEPVPKSEFETVLLKLAAIEKELSELRKASTGSYAFQGPEKRTLSAFQAEILQALADRQMTAGEVAEAVDRTRPLLVVNLNQMVALGLLEKEKKRRKIYFRQCRGISPTTDTKE